MIVVSDTSPIRALAFLEQLVVLEKLFGSVVIPPAVVNELSNPARLAGGETPADLSHFPFIEVRAPVGQARVTDLEGEIDRGESEAIVLAEELGCQAILMDEAAGRKVAIRRGLAPFGTAGILLRAKRAGFLAEVRPLLDRLIRRDGRRRRPTVPSMSRRGIRHRSDTSEWWSPRGRGSHRPPR